MTRCPKGIARELRGSCMKYMRRERQGRRTPVVWPFNSMMETCLTGCARTPAPTTTWSTACSACRPTLAASSSSKLHFRASIPSNLSGCWPSEPPISSILSSIALSQPARACRSFWAAPGTASGIPGSVCAACLKKVCCQCGRMQTVGWRRRPTIILAASVVEATPNTAYRPSCFPTPFPGSKAACARSLHRALGPPRPKAARCVLQLLPQDTRNTWAPRDTSRIIPDF